MQIELTTFYIRLGAIGLIIALGFLLGKLKLISEKTNRELTNLLLTVFMPAALFSAFPAEYDQASADLFFSGLVAGIVVMLLLIIFAKIIFNKKWFKGDLRLESQFGLIFITQLFSAIRLLSVPLVPVGY